jgi:hypothetical protein
VKASLVRKTGPRITADSSGVADYKKVLQQVLENRPSGTRGRLAEALGKNRSFISQITNPTYSVPIPARHVDRILETCHFLPAEKSQFFEAYGRAHPHHIGANSDKERWREIVLRVPDFRDSQKNKMLDELLKDTVQRILRLMDRR